MSYYRDVYLNSEDWKNLRAAILSFQGYQCECCGGKSTDVHHLLYRHIDDVLPMDLMSICRPCHELTHSAWEELPFTRTAKTDKKAGMDARQLMAQFISPRGFVESNVCFGPGAKSTHRITFKGKKTATKFKIPVEELYRAMLEIDSRQDLQGSVN